MKASIETMLVILLLKLKIFLRFATVDIKFWKTPSKITFKNLGSFKANSCGGVPF